MIDQSCTINSTENDDYKDSIKKSLEYFELDYLFNNNPNELLLNDDNNNKTEKKKEEKIKNVDLMDSKSNKIEVERFYILKEILSSENKYLNDLQVIVKGYYEGILNSNKDSNNELISDIFSNVKEIYDFTNNLYKDLEACNYNPIEFANCFIHRYNPFYELYSKYCQNNRNSLNASEKLEKNREAEKILQAIKQKYGHNFRLASYLQIPILHITRYHLLLNRYLKLTQELDDQKTYTIMLEALNVMKRVADGINNFLPPVNKVLNTIDMKKLIETYGEVIKEGELYLVEHKKSYYIILFENLFVIRNLFNSNVFYSIANKSLAFLPKSFEYKNSEKYFTVIDYSQCKNHAMSQFTFKARSPEEKRNWHSSLLNSMLEGYGKKLSDNVKTRMLQLDSNDEKDLKIQNKDINHGVSTNIQNSRKSWKFNIRKAINKTINANNKSSKRRFSAPNKQNIVTNPETNEIFVTKLSSISGISVKNNQNIDKLMLKKNTIPVMRTRRNSKRRKSQSKLSNEDDHSWSFKSSYDDEQRSSYESHSSRTSEYEISEHSSEQSSDTGIEVLSLNSQNTISNDETSYLNDNIKVKTYSDTVSSTSSLNSEEGYYSNHDTSLSTLIDENQISVTKVPIFKKKSPVSKRNFSFPEIKNQTNFKLLKMKEENKQLAKAEIEIYNSTCSLSIESNELPTMTVKYLSSVFDNSSRNLNKNLSSYTIDNLMINEDDQIIDENESVSEVQENLRPRSFSAFQINSLNDVDKRRPLNSRFNAIKRIGNNTFKVEKLIEYENPKDEFLLRDVFGSRLLVEAEHLFEPKFTLIRDLIKKFEKKN